MLLAAARAVVVIFFDDDESSLLPRPLRNKLSLNFGANLVEHLVRTAGRTDLLGNLLQLGGLLGRELVGVECEGLAVMALNRMDMAARDGLSLDSAALADRLGIRMQDVTYKGDAQQLNDFLAGTLDLLVVGGASAIQPHRNGQGRILAWTGERRLPVTPDIPNFVEFAPDTVAQTYFGLVAPARTPQPMIERVSQAAAARLHAPRRSFRLRPCRASPPSHPQGAEAQGPRRRRRRPRAQAALPSGLAGPAGSRIRRPGSSGTR